MLHNCKICYEWVKCTKCSVNKKKVRVDILLYYKSKTLQGVLFLKLNMGIINLTSHHSIVDYFPIRAHLIEFYFLHGIPRCVACCLTERVTQTSSFLTFFFFFWLYTPTP